MSHSKLTAYRYSKTITIVGLLFIIWMIMLVAPFLTYATTITVNSTSMTTANDGQCTLVEAITAANRDAASGALPGECPAGNGADTISLAAGTTYLITTANNSGTYGANGLPVVTSTITINGNGASLTVSSTTFRFFEINSVGKLTLNQMTLSAGGFGDTTSRYGGAIYNNGGTLTLNNSTLVNNSASDGGGAIYQFSGGTTTINNSVISSNHADGGSGGGIWAREGTLNVNYSTFSNNTTMYMGGGIRNDGTTNIIGSTFSGNSASGSGGGLRSNTGTVTITNSTFSNNYADQGGGGIYGSATIKHSTITNNQNTSSGNGGGINGTISLENSIVAGNKNSPSTGTTDCSGTITSNHNLFGSGTGCPTDSTSVTVNPVDVFVTVLGSLANNGGSTQTHTLLANSPAIDKGTNTDTPAFDQRGTGFLRIINSIVDIGAIEYGADTAATATAAAYLTATSQAATSIAQTATAMAGTATAQAATATALAGANQTATAIAATATAMARNNEYLPLIIK